MKRGARAVFAALMLIIACGVVFPDQGLAETSCGPPLASDVEWQTSTPEEAGFDANNLCSIERILDQSPELNIHAIVVVRRGKLVYETYRVGRDQRWGTGLGTVSHTPKTLHDVRSISKSVISLLIGIAVDRKLIASVNEPALSFFPELALYGKNEKSHITLQHLLTMTPGLAWDERRPYSDARNSERMMTISNNPYRFVFKQPVEHEPGVHWEYSGGTTQVLAGILERASGKSLTELAKEALFEPLGITQLEWVKMFNGEVAAASGLRLRPRDMAKIGELVLRNGLWNDRRIVSETWINQSTQPHVARIDPAFPTLGYGYQWWTDQKTTDEKAISWVAAQGLGGQRIYIVPAYDLVVVITAGLYAENSQNRIPYSLFEKHILLAIRD